MYVVRYIYMYVSKNVYLYKSGEKLKNQVIQSEEFNMKEI